MKFKDYALKVPAMYAGLLISILAISTVVAKSIQSCQVSETPTEFFRNFWSDDDNGIYDFGGGQGVYLKGEACVINARNINMQEYRDLTDWCLLYHSMYLDGELHK